MSDQTITDGLKGHVVEYVAMLGRKLIYEVEHKVDEMADRLDDAAGAPADALQAGMQTFVEKGSPMKAAASAASTGMGGAVKGLFGGGSSGSSSGGGGGDHKFMNIIETAEVGVPIGVAYNAFTEFEEWPRVMKKVERADWTDDTQLTLKGQVFLSHRTWESTITEMVADSHIVWRSTGEKGHISGSVSFHELAPRLTRIVVAAEYRPQGFVEKTGNLWRALGRRFRLELKFYVHYVMNEVLIDQESVEGFRGEIRDGELVETHEEAVEREAAEQEEYEQEEYEEEPVDEEEIVEDEEPDDVVEDGEEPVDEEPVEEEPEEVVEEEPADEEEVVDEEEPDEVIEDEEPVDEEEIVDEDEQN